MTPLVFLHGIGADAGCFAALQAELQPRPSYALNLPGYGETPLIESYDFPFLVTRLKTQLQDLGLSQVVLWGHSIGGMLALAFALEHHEICQGLVLSNTTPAFGGRDPSFKEAFLKQRLAPLEQGQTMADMAQQAVPHLVGRACSQAAKNQATANMARVPEDAFRQAIACLVTFDRRQALSGLDVPCLVLAGDQDTNAPSKTMHRMAESLPQADFECLEGGHLLPLEAPGSLAASTAAFLKKHAL